MAWTLGIGLTVGVGLFLYWQLIIAEGVYLGQKVVTLLYDRVAPRYNDIKEFDEQEELRFLAWPLGRALGDAFDGILIDVATGTGRLPAAMLKMAGFQGVIIGVDHSRRMLAVARCSIPGLPLVVADAMHLPFPTGGAQTVTCLEALEFFPRPQAGLQELTRLLAPDGLLLTTNRIGWDAKLMPGRTWSPHKLRAVLAGLPLKNIAVTPWLNIYQQVWAQKKQMWMPDKDIRA